MKTLFNRYVVVLIVLVLMGAGTLLAQNEHASGTGVEGTYLTNVIPDPNGPPPFQALFTLSAAPLSYAHEADDGDTVVWGT